MGVVAEALQRGLLDLTRDGQGGAPPTRPANSAAWLHGPAPDRRCVRIRRWPRTVRPPACGLGRQICWLPGRPSTPWASGVPPGGCSGCLDCWVRAGRHVVPTPYKIKINCPAAVPPRASCQHARRRERVRGIRQESACEWLRDGLTCPARTCSSATKASVTPSAIVTPSGRVSPWAADECVSRTRVRWTSTSADLDAGSRGQEPQR
jgi:hypothetical protein